MYNLRLNVHVSLVHAILQHTAKKDKIIFVTPKGVSIKLTSK